MQGESRNIPAKDFSNICTSTLAASRHVRLKESREDPSAVCMEARRSTFGGYSRPSLGSSDERLVTE